MDQYIDCITDGGNLLVSVILNQDEKPLCIISAYMPTTGTETDLLYDGCLDEIQEVMNKYSHCQFIVLGDMTASFIRPQPTKRDINFMSAIEDMNFVLPNNYPLDMTFHHYNGFATSHIFYLLEIRVLLNMLKSYNESVQIHILLVIFLDILLK